MSTIDDKETIDRLIANNGHYPAGDLWKEDPGADPPVMSVAEYQTPEGKTTWGICYPHDPPNKYRESEFVRSPRNIFNHAPHADCNHPDGM